MKKKILINVLCIFLGVVIALGAVFVPSLFGKNPAQVNNTLLDSVLTNGVQRFLCWDENILSKNNGVVIVQHSPQKQNIALECNDAWDGENGYAQVIKVGDTYRMYYHAWHQDGTVFIDKSQGNTGLICVAESKDGITFTKPNVGKIEYNGSVDNNIVFRAGNNEMVDTFTVLYDPNPNCNPNEKFKALTRNSGTNVLSYYISADGYEFEYVQRIILNGTFDSFNVVLWDEDEQQYCMYFRGFHHKDGTDIEDMRDLNETTDVRDIRYAVSKDFKTWEFVDYLQVNGQPDNVQLYTNQIVNYYREKGTYIGFPARYCDRVNEVENYFHMKFPVERERMIGMYGREGTVVTDSGIMTSRDGLNFTLSKKAFVAPNYESGNDWWYGANYTAYGLVETAADNEDHPNEISFYIGENYHIEKVDFRRYTIRLDGFFSWYADGDGAVVETRPFVLQKDNMSINFATSASGSLEIEILDKDGNAIEGYESGVLFGNSVNREVDFENALSDLVGEEIKIRFKMNDCHLYSYAFE